MSKLEQLINDLEHDFTARIAELRAAAINSHRALKVVGPYTANAAAHMKARIEEQYQQGNITSDKKRGMKMLVTKRTVGWVRPSAA